MVPTGAVAEHGVLPPCDCLNRCCDDDDVLNGRAQPCEWRLKRLEQKAQEEQDLIAIQRHIMALQKSSKAESLQLAEALQRIVNIRQRWNP